MHTHTHSHVKQSVQKKENDKEFQKGTEYIPMIEKNKKKEKLLAPIKQKEQ